MSDTGFIEDILNEEDQDDFVDSPRRDEPSLMKAESIRERQMDGNLDARAGSAYDNHRQHNGDFRGQQQPQKRHKAGSMQGLNSRKARAKYFIIRSGNMENVSLSYDNGAWATQVRNEHKLRDAFQSAENVYLIFSVNQSGHFQGYARMTTLPGKLGRNISWAGGHNVGNCFGVEWEAWSELPYEQVLDLRNPMNENKPIKISRDGQELPADLGDELINRLHQFSKQKNAPPRQNRNAGPGKQGGGRQGFNSNNHRGQRAGGNFDGFPDRPMGPRGMMDGFDMGMDGPMGPMGPMGPGVGMMGMGPGMGPMGMRPMMPRVMPNEGPMMDMMGGGMGMGMMMDGPMRPGMMMDPMNMRRNMGMGMHGPHGGPPPRNQSPTPFNHEGIMGGNPNMNGAGNNGPFPGPSRMGGPSAGTMYNGNRQPPSPSPERERGRSPNRRQRSGSRGRVHSRSRSRSGDRGRAPNLMEMSYDEYLEHYKKVQRRMREMQEMKVTSQQQQPQPPPQAQHSNMGGGSNAMGSNVFGGMMGMGGMNPMMSGMNQMMGGGMMPNMGMMYNNSNMGGMMSRSSGIMSEPEYVKLCQRYFASYGRPCPPEDKLRKYYRDMKAQWEMHMKQRS